MLDFDNMPKFNQGTYNISGARYTIKLSQLRYNNYNYWNPDPNFIDPFDNWVLFSDNYKETFKEYFYHYFYFYEIGSETPFVFSLKLNNEMNKIAPYYSQLLAIEDQKIRENINFMLPNWAEINTDSREQLESVKKILNDLKINIDQLQKEFQDSNKNSNSTNDSNSTRTSSFNGNSTNSSNTNNDTTYKANQNTVTNYGKVDTLSGTDSVDSTRYQVTTKNKNDGELVDTYESTLEGNNRTWDRGKHLSESTNSDTPMDGYVYDESSPSDNSENVGTGNGEWSGSAYISNASRSKSWYNPYIASDGDPEGAYSKSTSKLTEIQDRLDNVTDPKAPLVNRITTKSIGDGEQSITTYGDSNNTNKESLVDTNYGKVDTQSGSDTVNFTSNDVTNNTVASESVNTNENYSNDNNVNKTLNTSSETSNSNKDDKLNRDEEHITNTTENTNDNKTLTSATYSKNMANVYQSISDARENCINIFMMMCKDLRDLFLRVW